EARAGLERAVGRGLEHRTVRDRIAEREPELEAHGAGLVERPHHVERPLESAVAGHHEGGDPAVAAGSHRAQLRLEPVHRFSPPFISRFRSATIVSRSLSPRPETFTITRDPTIRVLS